MNLATNFVTFTVHFEIDTLKRTVVHSQNRNDRKSSDDGNILSITGKWPPGPSLPLSVCCWDWLSRP